MPDLYIADDQPQSPPQSVVAVPTPEDINPGQIELKKSEPHILTCFHEMPGGVAFENQREDEKILLFLRRHYTTNLEWQTGTILLAILPLALLAALPFLNFSLAIPLRFIIIGTIFYYLIVFGFAFVNFVIWFYNVGLVTNLRVIDVDVNSISTKDVAATTIQEITDISYKQSGFKQNLFDFGDVFMETEALSPNFEFLQVPHPARITSLISKLMPGGRV